MTATVATHPALASTALALPPAASPATTGAALAAPPAGAPTGLDSPAFTALLLGLRPAPGSAPAPATAPAGTGNAAPLPLPDAISPPLPGVTPPPFLPAAAAARDGHGSGAELPDSGTELPLQDLDALLASLEQATAPDATVTLVPAPAAVVRDHSVTPDPRSAPASDSAHLPAAGPPGTVSSAREALAEPALPQRAAGTGSATAPSPDKTARAAPAVDAMSAAPESAADSDPARGMDLALPAEFRARLDAALALASRPAAFTDPPVAGAPAFASSPLLNQPGQLPATTATSLPDSLPALQPLADRGAWSQGLGERLLMMADKGLQSATLRLQPEHLGPIEVKINVDEGGATRVLFSAHHAQTRDALETAMPRLRELFAEQGLNLAQANVDTGSSAFAQRGFAADLPAWNRWLRDEPQASAADEPATWRLAQPSGRRVDVFV